MTAMPLDAIPVEVLPGGMLVRHGVHWIPGDIVPLLPNDAAEMARIGVVRILERPVTAAAVQSPWAGVQTQQGVQTL